MPTFSADWFKNTAQNNWANLFGRSGWLDGRPLTIVEIGSFEGQSTVWMLENLLKHPDSRIFCIDTFSGGPEYDAGQIGGLRERFDANIAESGNAAKAEVMQVLSWAALVRLITRGVQADFVYVDGSHAAPDVLQDLVLSWRLLKVGGMMICDDYLWFLGNMDGSRPERSELVTAPKLAIDSFVNIYIRKLRILRGQPLGQFTFQKTAE